MSKPTGDIPPPQPIFVDTDAGCDDAIAIAWLIRRPEVRVVGFSTVYGNSSVQNTTANLLTLLEAMDCHVPVTMGASAPLAYPRSNSGALVHGPDGLWGAQSPVDISEIPQGSPGAIAAAAREHPGLTIIALGPLTNLARAVQAYPDDLRGVRLVVLGGARTGGNMTPTAEFNIFADPHALAVVLEAGMQVEMVTLDAFEQLRIDSGALTKRLATEGGRAGTILARALAGYASATTRGMGGPIAVPDAAAAIYALRPDLGKATPAAVRVVVDGELTRGQTIIAATFNHQIALGFGATGMARLADLLASGADLEAAIADALRRAPHNAQVILEVDGQAMADLLEAGLSDIDIERAVGG
jgi:purine nucleosidase